MSTPNPFENTDDQALANEKREQALRDAEAQFMSGREGSQGREARLQAAEQGVLAQRSKPLNLGVPLTQKPDTVAQNFKNARDAGVSPAFAAQAPDQVGTLARQNQINNAVQNAPVTRSYMEDTRFASLAHDDVENLTGIEQIVRDVSHVVRSFATWPFDLARAPWGLIKMAAENVHDMAASLPGSNDSRDSFMLPLAQYADANARSLRSMSYNAQGSDAGVSYIGKRAGEGVSSVGISLTSAAALLLTRNPVAARYVMGLSTAGDSYLNARDQGASVFTSSLYSGAMGVTEVLGEELPLQFLIKDLKAGSPFWKVLLHQMATESISESATTVAQNALDWAYLNPDKSASDWLAEQPQAVADTIVSTLFAVGLQTSMTHGLNRMLQRPLLTEEAKQTRKFLELLNARVKSSALHTRSSEDFKSFVQTAGEEGAKNIYVRGTAFAEALKRSDMSVEDLAAISPEVATLFQESQKSGGHADLVIPIGEHAAALSQTKLGDAILDDARLREDALSVNDVKELDKSQDAMVAEAEQALNEQGGAKLLDTIGDVVEHFTQMFQDPMYDFMSNEQRKSAVSLAKAYFVNLSRTTKRTPAALLTGSDGKRGYAPIAPDSFKLSALTHANQLETLLSGPLDKVQLLPVDPANTEDNIKREIRAWHSGTPKTYTLPGGGTATSSKSSTNKLAFIINHTEQPQLTSAVLSAQDILDKSVVLDRNVASTGTVDKNGNTHVRLFDRYVAKVVYDGTEYLAVSVVEKHGSGDVLYHISLFSEADIQKARQAQAAGQPLGMSDQGPGTRALPSLLRNSAFLPTGTLWQDVDLATWTPVPDGTEFVDVDGVQRPVYDSNLQLIFPYVEGIQNFWRNFKDTKAVDSDGRPVRVVHGTRNSKSLMAQGEFDPGRLGDATGAASAREGFFFSGNTTTANSYAIDDSGWLSLGDEASAVFDDYSSAIYGKLHQAIRLLHEAGIPLEAVVEELGPRTYAPMFLEPDTPQSYRLRDEDTWSIQGGPWPSTNNGITTAAKADNKHNWFYNVTERVSGALWELTYGSGGHVTDQRKLDAVLEAERLVSEAQDGILHDFANENFFDDYGNTHDFYLNLTNPLVHDMRGSIFRDTSYYDIIQQAKRLGHDGVVIKNTYDGGPLDDIYVAFNNKQMKSTENNGRFDVGNSQFLEQFNAATRWQDNPAFQSWSFGNVLDTASTMQWDGKAPVAFEAYHAAFNNNINQPIVDPQWLIQNVSADLAGNWYGAGFYLSSNSEDVGTNYGSLDAREIRMRVANYAEQFYNEPARTLLQADALQAPGTATQNLLQLVSNMMSSRGFARPADYWANYAALPTNEKVALAGMFDNVPFMHSMLAESRAVFAMAVGSEVNAGSTYPFYVRFQNALDLRPYGRVLEVREVLDADGNVQDYEGEGVDLLVKLFEQVNSSVSQYSQRDIDRVIGQLESLLSTGGFSAYAADQILRNSGLVFSGQYIQDAAREAGYDGLVHDASFTPWGQQRGYAQGTLHFIPFVSQHVKSSIGNNGNYSLASDATVLDQRDYAIPMSSPLDTVIRLADPATKPRTKGLPDPPKKGTAAQWKAWFESVRNKGFLRAEELADTGLLAWLSTHSGELTFAEIRTYVNDNPVVATITSLGSGEGGRDDEAWDQAVQEFIDRERANYEQSWYDADERDNIERSEGRRLRREAETEIEIEEVAPEDDEDGEGLTYWVVTDENGGTERFSDEDSANERWSELVEQLYEGKIDAATEEARESFLENFDEDTAMQEAYDSLDESDYQKSGDTKFGDYVDLTPEGDIGTYAETLLRFKRNSLRTPGMTGTRGGSFKFQVLHRDTEALWSRTTSEDGRHYWFALKGNPGIRSRLYEVGSSDHDELSTKFIDIMRKDPAGGHGYYAIRGVNGSRDGLEVSRRIAATGERAGEEVWVVEPTWSLRALSPEFDSPEEANIWKSEVLHTIRTHSESYDAPTQEELSLANEKFASMFAALNKLLVERDGATAPLLSLETNGNVFSLTLQDPGQGRSWSRDIIETVSGLVSLRRDKYPDYDGVDESISFETDDAINSSLDALIAQNTHIKMVSATLDIAHEQHDTDYHGGHWRGDYENTIAHARHDIFEAYAGTSVPSDGKLVIRRVQEIQSDLHQAGQEDGYLGGVVTFTAEYVGNDEWRYTDASPGDVTDLRNVLSYPPTQHRKMMAAGIVWDIAPNVPTTNAPFKKSWTSVLLRQMIYEAVNDSNNPSHLGFVPGDVQARRWGHILQKEMDTVELRRFAGTAPHRWEVKGYKNGNVVLSQTYKAQKLKEALGGPLLDALIKDMYANESDETAEAFGKVQGRDIKLGGSGIIKFYDERLINEMNTLLKKFGVRGKLEWVSAERGWRGPYTVRALTPEELREGFERLRAHPEWEARQAMHKDYFTHVGLSPAASISDPLVAAVNRALNGYNHALDERDAVKDNDRVYRTIPGEGTVRRHVGLSFEQMIINAASQRVFVIVDRDNNLLPTDAHFIRYSFHDRLGQAAFVYLEPAAPPHGLRVDENGTFYDEQGQQVSGGWEREFKGKFISFSTRLTRANELGGQLWVFPLTDEIRAAFKDEAGTLYQGEGTRKAFISFDPAVAGDAFAAIGMAAKADFSSFVHELSHFMLEVYADLVRTGEAPPEVIDDMKTLLREFQYTGSPEEWAALPVAARRRHHERFASTFEAYTMSGRVPSSELLPLFANLRNYMLDVYKELRGKRVQINAEVESVMAHMLAGREAVERMEQARSEVAMLKADMANRPAGMPEHIWHEYCASARAAHAYADQVITARSARDMKWLSNAKSRVIKELQQLARNTRKKVRKEVEADLAKQRVYRTREVLAGRMPDGSTLQRAQRRLALKLSQGSTKLDTTRLREMMGDGPAAAWRYLPSNALASENGADPQAIADFNGYDSVDAMVKELVSAPSFTDAARDETERRMQRDHSHLLDPKALEDAADKAVHNQFREKFLATELRALEMASGNKTDMSSAAIALAKRTVAETQVKKLSFNRFATAAANAAKAALRAFGEGKTALAANEKRNQLVNFAAAREAVRVQAELTRKRQRLAKNIKRAAWRQAVGQDALDQMESIMVRFGLMEQPQGTGRQRSATLAEYVAAQDDIGIGLDLAPQVLDETQRSPLEELTVEQALDVLNGLIAIERSGRFARDLLIAGRRRTLEALKADVLPTISVAANGRTVDNTTRNTLGNKATKLFRGFLAMHRKLSSQVFELDNFGRAGPLWNALIRPMNLAGDREARMRADASNRLAELFAPISGTKLAGDPRLIRSINRSLTREERLVVALNVGNEGNLQRLMDGANWTQDTVDEILDHLTQEEWAFVQGVWDLFESYKPLIREKERRVTGVEPNWVEPREVATKFGTLRGGYYPVKYDPAVSPRAEAFASAEDAKQMMRAAFTASTTRRSFTKSRAQRVTGRPLLLTLAGVDQGLNEVIHDLCWHEWVITANSILRDAEIDSAIRTGWGAEWLRAMKDTVKAIATEDQQESNAFTRIIGTLRNNVTMAALGFNFATAAMQLTGLSQTAQRITPKYMTKGLKQYINAPRVMHAWVVANSTFMDNRTNTMQREISELLNTVTHKDRKATFTRAAMSIIAKMQEQVDMVTWLGAYQGALAETPEGMTEEETHSLAVALADQAVIDAQGGGQIKDLAGAQRGGALMKLFTNFYSYMNTLWNLNVEAVKSRSRKGEYVGMATDLLLLNVVPAFLTLVIKGLLKPGDDDDDSVLAQLPGETLSSMFGMLVGVRDTAAAVKYAVDKTAGVDAYMFDYKGPAGLRFYAEFQTLMKRLSDGKLDGKTFKAALNVMGLATGIPTAQLGKTLEGAVALLEGDTSDPRALISGAPKN